VAAILETARLTAEPVAAADAPFMRALLTSRGFVENIGDRGVRSDADALAYIERLQAHYRDHGFGMWLVRRRADAEPVGLAGLLKREVLEHVDVGYAFLESAWGQGYAQEIAAACLRYAQAVLGLPAVAAITSVGNLASRRVLEKVGLRFVDVRQLPGWDEPSAYYLL